MHYQVLLSVLLIDYSSLETSFWDSMRQEG